MKTIKKFDKPIYISADCSRRFSEIDKKNRFRTKYIYLFSDQIMTTLIQDCGADVESDNYFEWFLN